MKNPWTSRNPWMSMWLSGANTIAGSARSRAMTEGKRHAAIAMKKNMQQIVDFWSGAWLTPPAKQKKRRRR